MWTKKNVLSAARASRRPCEKYDRVGRVGGTRVVRVWRADERVRRRRRVVYVPPAARD